MEKLLLWKDMTPEEREELRERLDKAGIPKIISRGARKKSKQKYEYNLTAEQFDKLLNKQDGKCAICGNHMGDVLVIDHDHETGKIRGLLCARCNRFVEYIENTPFLVEKIKEYLK